MHLAHNVGEVRVPETFVPVREDGEANDNIRVCELAALAREILAHEWNGRDVAGARHIRVLLARALHIVVVHDAERDAVDLLDGVRQIAVEPFVGQVEHLDERLFERANSLRELRFVARVRTHRHVRHCLFLAEACEVVRLEEEHQPLCEQRLHAVVVVVVVEQDQVRGVLQRVVGQTVTDALSKVLQHLLRLWGLLQRNADAPCVEVEERVNKVNRQAPAQRSVVNVVLGTDGEVQFGLERVQQKIDLVHDKHTITPQRHEAPNVVDLLLQHRGLRARRILDSVETFDVLQENGLDGTGRGHDDAAALTRVLELGDDLAVDIRAAIAHKREDLFLENAGEGRAEDGTREVQEGRWYDLNDERVPISQHQRQQRPHDRRLSGAHDHLLDKGFVIAEVRVHVPDKLNLSRAQRDVPRELEEHVARVELHVAVNVDTLRREDRRAGVCFLHNGGDEGVLERVQRGIVEVRRWAGNALQEVHQALDRLARAVDVTNAIGAQDADGDHVDKRCRRLRCEERV
eukprot:PhM_4_TR13981/c0_g1_i1/m.81554